jgi:hypothetical protein
MPEYLNTYLNWDPVQQRIREMATRGVSQANVSASKLAELEVRIIQAAQSRRLAEEVWSNGLACARRCIPARRGNIEEKGRD